MDKTLFIHQMGQRHPEASGELLELAWHLHSVEKAESYARELRECGSYADIANKVIREMYVNGDIDARKACGARFIESLLPFVCMDRKPKAHSVAYHVRNMLREKKVIAARQRNLSAQRGEARRGKYAIQAQFNIYTDNKEVVRVFAQLFQALKASTSRMRSVATWNSIRRSSMAMAC